MDLKYRPDGSFLIAQFTDLHLSEGKEPDLKTQALVAAVLDAEKPDLAVLTGDVIAGAGNPCADAPGAWKLAVDPMEARGIPWAAALGNHDDEGSHSREGLLQVQAQFKLCLSHPGPDGLPGHGNFILDIEDDARLYVLDSLAYGPEGISQYAWISLDQIQWFRERAVEAAGRKGLAFFHIPLPEYDEVWRTQVCRGHKFEKVCCPTLNSGLFSAMVEAKNIAGVFVGHDHINDYEGTLHGIRLCYGRSGGYNSYGKEGFPRGARLIRLWKGKPGFESWLRLEGGAVVTEQPQHAPEFPEAKP
jgi:hypothetical protein